MAKIKKRVVCNKCGAESYHTYDTAKQKMSRKFKCGKCGSGSAVMYNF
jgi:predicted nucleic-acid-binding Zn-ribbon protein